MVPPDIFIGAAVVENDMTVGEQPAHTSINKTQMTVMLAHTSFPPSGASENLVVAQQKKPAVFVGNVTNYLE